MTSSALLKNAVVKSLKAGLPVFFGCDVGKFSDRDAGIMDPDLYEFEVRGLTCYSLFVRDI